jgi:hypothetical protein
MGGFVFGTVQPGLIRTRQKGVRGENCQWQFGNESSLESLLSKQKFGGRADVTKSRLALILHMFDN